MSNRCKYFLPIFLLFFFSFFYCSVSRDELVTLDGVTMGTFYNVKIVKKGVSAHTLDLLPRGIQKVLDGVNQKMSTYIQDSEISRLNRNRATDWIPVSPELYKVLWYALQTSKKSNGAFDITVGPLVNLWGFGPEKNRENTIPPEKEIRKRLVNVGYQKLLLRADPPAVKKLNPKIYCDLSAIAKGYGVDKVADYLDSLQVTNYLVEVGGEIRARGLNQKRADWRIGISSPAYPNDIEKIISVTNRAVATSGDYRNYFEKDGIRYSHTIDPTTGRPITHHLASVTVIHDSCMVADAMATAIDVLGPQKGYDLAQKEELAVFLIVKKGNKFVEKMTPQFKKILLLK